MKKGMLLAICITVLAALWGCGSSGEPLQNDDSETENTGPTANDISKDVYPYDIEQDRETFDANKIDIIVGDKLYMTQINDWFINFADYEGKSVVIEGYYMIFQDKYTFVGRKGPTCPYCTGGYVNFEFKSDQDLSDLKSESSWIRVSGILREGQVFSDQEDSPQVFYYIEAIHVEKMKQVGKGTITD